LREKQIKKRKFTKKRIKTAPYIREVDLQSLISLWPKEIEDFSVKGTLIIIAKLKTALRAERKRAYSSHWAYSLTKHKALVEALKYEEEILNK
jgi:hypothetical protein